MRLSPITSSILASLLLLSTPALANLPGYTVVRVNENATIVAGGVKVITVSCPAGKKVLGGGSGNNAFTWARVVPVLSMPSPNSSTFNTSETQWTVGFMNLGTSTVTLNLAVYAICASP